MKKVELQQEVNTLRTALEDMKQDRDGLLVRNHELTRKFEHEVGRLNTIIANYRAQIVNMGLGKEK